MAICPICDLQVDDEVALKKELTTEYDGVFYHFDTPECKECFESDPHGYVSQLDRRHWQENVEQGVDR
jgi:YHS domain-containing protein